jgi:phosphate transport system protein
MSKFHEELDALRIQVAEMGVLAESMIAGASRALTETDGASAREVLAVEPRLDRCQVDLDREAIRLITIYSPVAKDLRVLLMIARIVSELERIGDQAVNNCEYAALSSVPVSYPEVREIARVAQAMLHDALDAFRHEDTTKADEVLRRDDRADALDARILHTWLARTAAAPDSGAIGARAVLAARSFERIADHATNICEEVFYLVEGADIRHRAV